jgi:hypothetical protein
MELKQTVHRRADTVMASAGECMQLFVHFPKESVAFCLREVLSGWITLFVNCKKLNERIVGEAFDRDALLIIHPPPHEGGIG